MTGKIGGAGAEVFQPAPFTSPRVYDQPTSNPGFAPYPPASVAQTPGQATPVIPGQAVPGIPTK